MTWPTPPAPYGGTDTPLNVEHRRIVADETRKHPWVLSPEAIGELVGRVLVGGEPVPDVARSAGILPQTLRYHVEKERGRK